VGPRLQVLERRLLLAHARQLALAVGGRAVARAARDLALRLGAPQLLRRGRARARARRRRFATPKSFRAAPRRWVTLRCARAGWHRRASAGRAPFRAARTSSRAGSSRFCASIFWSDGEEGGEEEAARRPSPRRRGERAGRRRRAAGAPAARS
jgi:hypothetical protein